MDGGCLQGNCPQGVVNELRTATNEAHDFAEHATKPQADAIEAKFEEIETWLVDDSTASCGAVDKISMFVSELNALCT